MAAAGRCHNPDICGSSDNLSVKYLPALRNQHKTYCIVHLAKADGQSPVSLGDARTVTQPWVGDTPTSLTVSRSARPGVLQTDAA
jgi:hypothetical protein